MREVDSSTNWFSKWEEELPSLDELTPLSQTLITPDLALAFDIRTPETSPISLLRHHHHQTSSAPPPPPPPHSSEFDSSSTDLGGGGGYGGADQEPAPRTLKRPRLVWTPQLHKRFVDAVAHLGIKNAVPKTIMQLMSVDGLTRENVASHLQKYRLYLKRMQGLTNGAGPGPGDSATDRLFASSPVPAHFLNRPGPYVPVHQLQMSQFEQNPFVLGQRQQAQLGPPSRNNGMMVQSSGYHHHHHHVEDVESINGRKVLSLFPPGDD